jgi:hypothetical protein
LNKKDLQLSVEDLKQVSKRKERNGHAEKRKQKTGTPKR